MNHQGRKKEVNTGLDYNIIPEDSAVSPTRIIIFDQTSIFIKNLISRIGSKIVTTSLLNNNNNVYLYVDVNISLVYGPEIEIPVISIIHGYKMQEYPTFINCLGVLEDFVALLPSTCMFSYKFCILDTTVFAVYR